MVIHTCITIKTFRFFGKFSFLEKKKQKISLTESYKNLKDIG